MGQTSTYFLTVLHLVLDDTHCISIKISDIWSHHLGRDNSWPRSACRMWDIWKFPVVPDKWRGSRCWLVVCDDVLWMTSWFRCYVVHVHFELIACVEDAYTVCVQRCFVAFAAGAERSGSSWATWSVPTFWPLIGSKGSAIDGRWKANFSSPSHPQTLLLLSE